MFAGFISETGGAYNDLTRVKEEAQVPMTQFIEEKLNDGEKPPFAE
jgi:hypothetical protein